MSLKLKMLFLSLIFLIGSAAFAQPIISVNPSDLLLNFGNVAVNSDSVRTITISNSNSATENLIVSNLTIVGTNPSQFSVLNQPTLPMVLTPGQSASPIQVQFAPSSFGQKFAFFRIVSNDPDPARDTVNVVLTGTGLAPNIGANPNPLQFGQLTVNTELILTVNITNTGNINLTITNLQLTGTNVNQFSLVSPPVPPITITPNGTPVPVRVRFRPTSAGAKTAALRLTSNDPDENPFNVTLTGSGVSPTISITPTSLNFGKVLVNDDSIRTLSISNTGQGNLFIQSLDIGSDPDTLFTLVNPPQLPDTIPPGGGPLTIRVKFSPKAEGTETANLLIIHNDPSTPTPYFSSIQLSGEGVYAQISVTPIALSYGDVTVTEYSNKSVEVSNIGEGPLYIDDARIIGANASQFSLPTLPPLPIKINPGAPPVNIVVRFAPTSIGTKQAFFILLSNDPDPPVSVALEGYGVKPDIAAFPPDLDYAEVPVGETEQMSTAIKNVGNIDLIVSGISIVGADSTQFVFTGGIQLPFTVRPGIDSVNVFVEFAPTSAGLKEASLRFVNNTPDENPFDVPLAGTGTVPDIAAQPNPMNIGDVLIHEQSDGIVNISNQGRAPLHITNAVLTGEYAHLFSVISIPPFPITIPPDTSVKVPVTVRFQPDSLGLREAELLFSSNDPDENPFIVFLRGTGVQADIGTNPAVVNFDSVRVKTDSTITVQIFNTGSATLVVTDTAFFGRDKDQFSIERFPLLPFSIPVGGAPREMDIRFFPDTLGEKIATFRFFSNAPDTILDLSLSGIGVEPEIAPAPDTLDFGKVVINTASILPMGIANLGGASLTISSASIIGGDSILFHFVTAPTFPIKVSPGDTMPIPVSFLPTSLGPKTTELHFMSDDPNTPELVVPALGIGAIPIIEISLDTLEFGNVAVNSQKILSLEIFNLGSAPLIISDTLISGVNAADYSIIDPPVLPLVIPDGGGSVSLKIGFKPGSNARKSAQLQLLSNDPDNLISTIELRGRGVQAPTINSFVLSNVVLRQDVEVTASVSADTLIQSVIIRYGPGNTLDFPILQPLVMQGEGIYTGTIEGRSVTTSGLNVMVEVTDVFPVSISDTLLETVNIPAGAIADTVTQNEINRWAMYSLPFNSTNSNIDGVLSDLGPEGDFTWRIYRTDSSGVNSNYYTRTELNEMGDYGDFKPGNAFWLYLRDDNQGKIPTNIIKFPEMNTVRTDSFNYVLQPGWNQIGSPYAFNITWDQVDSKHKDSLQVYRYDGGENFTLLTTGGKFNKIGWTPMVNTNFAFEPWHGYAVRNNAGVYAGITFYPLRPDTSGLAQLAKAATEADWQIKLVAENDLNFDICVVGMNARAREHKDYLDFVNPSPVGNSYVSMYFHHGDWNTRDKDFSTDFRPLNNDGKVWYFSINSSSKFLDFHLRELANLPANFRVMVFDTKYRNKYYLNEEERVTFRNIENGEKDRFALLIGTQGFIDSEVDNVTIMQPNEYQLMANYPNPFNPVTYIRYQLARPGDVKLIIYNVLGQEVATLVDSYSDAGFYEIQWDGKTNIGTEAASGVYFYQLRSQNFVQTMKMLKLK